MSSVDENKKGEIGNVYGCSVCNYGLGNSHQ